MNHQLRLSGVLALVLFACGGSQQKPATSATNTGESTAAGALAGPAPVVKKLTQEELD
jgi:hypothetical protein